MFKLTSKLSMKIKIGKKIRQKEGFLAFIPNIFPPEGIFDLPKTILLKTAEADRLIGKLDGITHLLPDVDFFISMFVFFNASIHALTVLNVVLMLPEVLL